MQVAQNAGIVLIVEDFRATGLYIAQKNMEIWIRVILILLRRS
jgi:hypothetical protein